jgi:hypothetical protein
MHRTNGKSHTFAEAVDSGRIDSRRLGRFKESRCTGVLRLRRRRGREPTKQARSSFAWDPWRLRAPIGAATDGLSRLENRRDGAAKVSLPNGIKRRSYGAVGICGDERWQRNSGRARLKCPWEGEISLTPTHRNG